MPKFDILASGLDVQENVTRDIKGSELNHTEFISDINKMNSLLTKIKNITTPLRFNGTKEEYLIQNYDNIMWSVDKLKNATPNVNWDKILLGIYGRTNITEKILIIDVNFANRINNIVKEVDKR